MTNETINEPITPITDSLSDPRLEEARPLDTQSTLPPERGRGHPLNRFGEAHQMFPAPGV